MMRGVAIILSAAAAVLSLAACGEKPQTAGTRKSDTSPYAAATNTHTAAGWKAGDTVSWERQLSSRAQYGQNEYTRTGMAAGVAPSSGPTPAPTTAPMAAPASAAKP